MARIRGIKLAGWSTLVYQTSDPATQTAMITRRPTFCSLLAALLLLPALPPVALAAQPGGASGNAAVVAAAEAFLRTLDEPTRQRTVFPFSDDTQRKRWSNLPTGMFKRTGARYGDLTAPQRAAALALLRAAFSPAGYEKVIGIMESDEFLKQQGNNPMFGRDEFYLSFVGKPSGTDPWMIQFGGHHLALNITLAGDRGTLAPSHTATQPARFTLDQKSYRPMEHEERHAFALIQSLDAEQRKQAILGAEFRDLVLGPSQEFRKLMPEGIRAATFTPAQRGHLMDLVRQWVGILHPQAADAKMREIEQGLDETWFAWSGPTTPGSAAYFRIQGPAVHIEYAPQRLGGDPTQHIHTIYRDPTNEYGRQWWKP